MLERTLSAIVIIQSTELLTIKVIVKIDIKRLEFTSAEMLKKDI